MGDSIKIKLVSPKMSLRPMDSEFKRLMSPSLSLVGLPEFGKFVSKLGRTGLMCRIGRLGSTLS